MTTQPLPIPQPKMGWTPSVTNPLLKGTPDWIALAKATRQSLEVPLQPQLTPEEANAKADAIIKVIQSQTQSSPVGKEVGSSTGIASQNAVSGGTIPAYGADTPLQGFTPEIEAAIKEKGVGFYELPVETQKAIVQANQAQQSANDAQHHHPSVLGRVLDVISRPMYASANAVDATVKNIQTIAGHGGTSHNPLSAAWEGLEGKKKTDYAQVLGDAGVKNPIIKAVGGLAGDVLLDPSTYLTLGASKVATGVKEVETADKALKGAKDVEKLLPGKSLSEILEHLNPAAAKGTVPDLRQAATITRNANSEVIEPAAARLHAATYSDVVKTARDSVEDTLRSAGLRPDPSLLHGGPQWQKVFDQGMKAEAKKLGTKTVAEAASKQADAASRSITENLAQIVSETAHKDFTRHLGLRAGKKELVSFKLPERVNTLGHGDKVADKFIKTVQRHFAETRQYPGLKHIFTMHAVHPATIVAGADHRIAQGLKGLTHKEEQTAFENYRTGALAAGRATKGIDHLGQPVTNDAEFLHNEISEVEKHINSLGDKGLSAWIQRAPYDLSFKGLKRYKKLAKGKSGWLHDYLREDPTGKFSSGKYSNPKNVLHAMNHMSAQQEVMQKVYDSLADLGVHRFTESAKGYEKQGYRTAKIIGDKGETESPVIGKLQHTLFHPEVARQVEMLHHTLTNHESINGLLRGFDRAQSLFKSSVTKYLPSFHSRNLLNEIINNFQAGVPFAKGNVYKKALKVMHSRGLVDHDAYSQISGSRALRNIQRSKNAEQLQETLAKSTERMLRKAPVGKEIVTTLKDGTPLSIDQIWNLYIKHGGRTNFIGHELMRSLRSDKGVSGALGHVQDAAQVAADATETFPRLAHFIHKFEEEYDKPYVAKAGHTTVVDKHLDKLDQAAQRAMSDVHKHHFDYSDLTKTEKQVMRRLVPFYTWTRKAIPYVLHMLATQPGRLSMEPKLLNAISGASGFSKDGNEEFPHGDFITPSWLSDEMAVPVGSGKGGSTYLSPNAASLYSIGNLISHPTDPTSYASIMRMLTPALKIPIEESYKSAIGGAPITSQSKYFQGQNPGLQKLEQLLGFGQHTPTDSTTVPNAFTGLGLVENTPARQLSAAKHLRTIATSAKKGKKK